MLLNFLENCKKFVTFGGRHSRSPERQVLFLEALLHKSKFNFNLFFLKKIIFFLAVVLVKTFPLMYNYYCKTDIEEARLIFFLGAQTETQFQNSHI